MARGAGEPSAKRTKVDEDPLVRRKEEVVRLLEEASAKGKELVRKAEEEAERLKREAGDTLYLACADIEAANLDELLKKLPPELLEKILDENLDQNDLLALAMTCRFFRDTTRDLGKKLETNLKAKHLLELRKSGKTSSHSLGWFRWVCDTLNTMPGFKWGSERVEGVVYEGDLVTYAAFQGSVEILRWLMEEKGCELAGNTCWHAGMGGSIEVFEYLRGRGYEFDGEKHCEGAARGGRLEALQFLRGLDPPCPWDWGTCHWAAREGHLEILEWARDQDPPCPWFRGDCRDLALKYGHQHIIEWIDQREDESDAEFPEGEFLEYFYYDNNDDDDDDDDDD